MAAARHDPVLGAGPSDDDDISLLDSDSGSLLSEDSVLPDYERLERDAGKANTLYEACARNEAWTLRVVLERGVTRAQAMELDINGRNGLMVAVSKGFVDIVDGLHTCPFIDVNHQDNDGNTALMIAAQAGFITILNFILNYYAEVDMEVRDPRGFTALIKAGLQGREECVSALIMHGADINAMDHVRGRGLKEWCLKTGRYETLNRMRRLQAHPIALQFCDSYVPEWPDLKHLVAKATATKSATQKIAQRIKDRLSFRLPHDPEDNGVFDHMVRITTSIHSPLVATGSRPLCPTSPPEIGRRRLAVPELIAKHSAKELEETSVSHSDGSVSAASPSGMSTASVSLISCCQQQGRRESVAPGGGGFMSRKNVVFPSSRIPRIEFTRATEPTPKKEKKKKKKKQKGYLEPPIWKYKEEKQEKKKEKLRLEQEKEEQEKKLKAKKKEKSKEKSKKK